MKKLRTNMDKYLDTLNDRWRAFPIWKQHQYILCVFVGYLFLTAGVIFKVWQDTSSSSNSIIIEHIENPVLKKKDSPAVLQDTVSTIIKNENYERK